MSQETCLRAFPTPTAFQRLSGGLAATFFSSIYIVAPMWLIITAVLVTLRPFWWFTWLVAFPVLLSAVAPPVPSSTFLQMWPFKFMPAYFDYTEYREQSDEEIRNLIETKNVLFCAQPHGVFSFGGACAGVEWSKRWWNPKTCPTAVASSVLTTPLIKHAVGLFGTVDAGGKSLSKALKISSVVLYIGGIAELFLCSDQEERLFIKKRKGFVKLAMRAGVPIVPVYFFGNTSVLQVLVHPVLQKIARSTGITLTVFWGLFGSPIPRPNPITGVIGRPIEMPHVPEPTDEDVDKYHLKYVEEVQRLFEKYKKHNPDYEGKALSLE